MSAVLAATAVAKSFTARPLLTDISIDISPGELVVIAGLPGAGRSALLKCLAGVYRPSAGSVVLSLGGDAVDLATSDTRTVAWVQRQHLTYFDGLLAASPSQDAAGAVARRAGIDRAAAGDALGRLGFRELAEIPLGRLRPEQRRSVALAAALSTACAVLLLDEPDSAADQNRVADWVADHRSAGAAVIATIATQGPLTAAASASAVLYEGKLKWDTR